MRGAAGAARQVIGLGYWQEFMVGNIALVYNKIQMENHFPCQQAIKPYVCTASIIFVNNF